MLQLSLFAAAAPHTVCLVYFDGTGIVSGKGPLVAVFANQVDAACLLEADIGYHWKWGRHSADKPPLQSRPARRTMSTNSRIEWCEATWNPTTGCTRVSAGCDNCYAVAMSHRLDLMGQPKYAGLTVLNGKGDRHFNGVVRTHEDTLTIPLKWKKGRRIFVNSMSDLFHKDVPFDFVDKVFAVMALCLQHTFQVLTKRPERMAEYMNDPYRQDCIKREIGDYESDDWVYQSDQWSWPLAGVWLGTSTENQAAADERIPHLLRCPAAVRFLSVEPLLGPVDLSHLLSTGGIQWVIVGGESGPGARPCSVEWIRSIVAQCKAAGASCFVKQLGSLPSDPCDPRHRIDRANNLKHRLFLADRKGGDIAEFPEEVRVREMPTGPQQHKPEGSSK